MDYLLSVITGCFAPIAVAPGRLTVAQLQTFGWMWR